MRHLAGSAGHAWGKNLYLQGEVNVSSQVTTKSSYSLAGSGCLASYETTRVQGRGFWLIAHKKT